MTGAPRILLAKVGLDGHDTGVLLIAKHLIAAGAEVVYLGKRNLPETIVAAALAEDAAVVGVGALSGGLGGFAIEVVHLLAEQEADIPVVMGGIAEADEVSDALGEGVQRHFGPGVPMREVVATFLDLADRSRL